MKYQISHLTRYSYQQPIANSYNLACLTPRTLPYQQLLQFELAVDPEPSALFFRQDKFGNQQHFIHLQPPHQQLTVTASSVVEVQARHNSSRLSDAMRWPELKAFLQHQHDSAVLEAKLCAVESRMIPALAETEALIKQLADPALTVLQLSQALTETIYHQFEYDPAFSSVVTPLTEVLRHKKGVCQDFAQLAISALRSLGIPARYVSGYLETMPPPGQTRLVGADASHAWFAVFDPWLGWVDFDPTNNLLPDERHITLAYGRDYADVVPLKGLLHGNGLHQLSVEVDVVPV
jgi:transglutaminase-like putative cysteine protease